MSRSYIIDALTAILEDVTGYRIKVPMTYELEAFFEPEEFDTFCGMVQQEFDLPDDTILMAASTFRELLILLEDELS